MWFGLGIISFLSFSAYFAYSRWQASWSGDPAEIDGTPYQLEILRQKGVVQGFRIGVDIESAHQFALKRERWWDRLFKKLGITVEHQVGNQEFDDALYVMSDDQAMLEDLSANHSLQSTLLELYEGANEWTCKFKILRLSNERLWVHYTGRFDAEENLDALASHIIPLLSKVKKAFTSFPQPIRLGWRDPFALKAALFLGISTGLAITAFILLIKLGFSNAAITLDDTNMFYDAVYIGLGFILFLVIAVMVTMGRTARTHLVLIELILVGSLGAIGTSFGSMRDLNIEYDKYGATTHKLKVIKKYIKRGSKGGSIYYLRVEDWTGEWEWRRIKVSSSMYKETCANDIVSLDAHSGYLGYRWIDRIQRADVRSKICGQK